MRMKIVIYLILALVGLGLGYFFTNSYEFGLCLSDQVSNTYDVSCHSFYERVGDGLFFGMGAVSFIFLVLLAMPRAFKAWSKFALWFIPLGALLMAFYPEPRGFFSVGPNAIQVIQWVSALYVLVSMVIIVIAAMRSSTPASTLHS
jgi:hypothetical protein